MMSSEYDRLIEAWIAGELTEGEVRELFRSAEHNPELARLLTEQENVSRGLVEDRSDLRSHFDGAALRAHVADLSRNVGIKGEGAAVGGGSRFGVAGAGRWIAGVLLLGGAAVGIYLAGENSSNTSSLRDETQPAIESVSSAPMNSTESEPAIEGVDRGSQKRTENSSANTETPSVLQSIGQETNSSKPDSLGRGRTTDEKNRIGQRPNDEIPIRTEVEGLDKLP